ncbi:hypothetical protein HMPREF1639_06105 [Peptostreptococcus sp. MV1]|nr:hypothetical protein HMPREF1639_06105 [Peptostreptococcus sp. MV1]
MIDMNYTFDRDIMRWFDYLFENRTNTLRVDNFICNMYDELVYESMGKRLPLPVKKFKDDNVISLEKKGSNFWTISFLLPSKYVYRLRENVHPYFGHYIYENISIYNNDEVYSLINKYIADILNFMVDYVYYPEEGDYYIDYRDDFIKTCSSLELGKRVLITDDIYMWIKSDEEIDFVNRSKSFNMKLRFDSSSGQELMDAIIDLSRSILLTRR